MRCLRRTTTAALLGLALTATPAYAGDLAAAIRVANAVYPGVPQRCGTVKVEYGTLMAENEADGAIAEAHESECRVVIKPGIADSYSDARLCSLLTHEWGHLAGQRFPENASDPYHSPSPSHHMYGPSLVHHPACGDPDVAMAAREPHARTPAQNAAATRDLRLGEIGDRLGELKDQLRALRAAKRRADGARRARYEKRIRRLRAQIRTLRAEYRSLASAPLL